MKVQVWMKETSQPITHDAVNTYTKGPMYCVFTGAFVHKYPIESVWKVIEQYGEHGRTKKEKNP